MKIDPELEKLIPPLSTEEFEQLEKNCCENGIRDSLVVGVFPGSDGVVLIDGHNRYKIAQKCNLSFTEKRLDFASKEKAIEWIILNQFGRRNLSAYDRSILALKLKPIVAERAKEQQGKRTDICQKSDKSKPIDTKKIIADTAKVSHDTIHKVEVIHNSGDKDLEEKVRSGEVSINQAHKQIINKLVKPKDPVKEAKERHEQFQEAKQNSVVNFQQAKQDESDKELLSIDLYQEICKAVHGFDKLALLRNEEQIGELFDSMEKYCFGDLSNRLTRTYRLILWLQRELEERR